MGKRLDAALAEKEIVLSRSKAQKLIKGGKVTVNGKVVKKPAYVIKEGDDINFEATEGKDLNAHIDPVDMNLDILYEDDSCLVINKPSGIAVHPSQTMGKDESTILNGIAFIIESKGLLVHRLDKETTGCLLIAKSEESLAFLQKQFADRTVKKTYLALVSAIPSPASATIDAPIGRNLVNRTLMSIFKTRSSREAKTTYRTLEVRENSALLECDLHTGRTHQIRVHLRSIGHPILGDPSYGTQESKKVSAQLGIDGLCLHALRLSFNSPRGKRVDVEAPLTINNQHAHFVRFQQSTDY
ncbi:MAG: RluA family pseudouridine synthase [Candidatus Peribacteraceae bacterium]|jgi:23S rRNA pseudouridine1911/1915/1917 synthase|nr:RluA family pseudouridine synthase [Candidatus Peribacteraceae bacterium]MDP7454053.1 RluA family pseudouridine synthase [Candidatus Peribacteraceae bacterium]|tara:strand:+ start:2030 stop:2926 length:897 start_codon:yes stop_codon:yes gene_type:complete